MQKGNAEQENKMGTMPVGRLLATMSIPMMISMLVQALYNIVDSIFVSRVSEHALTAVSMAFPIQTLMIAAAGGLGVGINALLSRSLGQKDTPRANRVAAHGVLMLMVAYLVFLLIGLFAAEPFMRAQSDIPEIYEDGVIYLRICCICSLGLFMQFAFERLLTSTGLTIYSMVLQLVGAIINIVLDPILIFGLFGLPKMGIAGAAAATVIGQIIAALCGFVANRFRNREIHLTFRGFTPDVHTIKEILSIGVPSMIMQAIGSVMTFGMNLILGAFSSTAVAVFGVYFKLQSFVFMPVFGLNNGMVPIIAYNYGARRKDRMLRTIVLSMVAAVAIMVAGFAVVQLIPEQLLMLFDASEHMLEIGVPALRAISLSFLFAGFCIVGSSVFQALGNGVYSMIMSIVRQLLVLLPSAFVLAKIGGLHMVWYSFIIAEGFSVALCIFFLRKTNQNVPSKL